MFLIGAVGYSAIAASRSIGSWSPNRSHPPNHSQALVPSAADLKEEILTAGFMQIEKEAEAQRLTAERNAERKHEAAIEKKIKDHYYREAHAVFKALWVKCRKTTGHTYSSDQYLQTDYIRSGKFSGVPRACTTCGHPTGWNAKARERDGVEGLAWKLRAADTAAGVEFIPK